MVVNHDPNSTHYVTRVVPTLDVAEMSSSVAVSEGLSAEGYTLYNLRCRHARMRTARNSCAHSTTAARHRNTAQNSRTEVSNTSTTDEAV